MEKSPCISAGKCQRLLSGTSAAEQPWQALKRTKVYSTIPVSASRLHSVLQSQMKTPPENKGAELKKEVAALTWMSVLLYGLQSKDKVVAGLTGGTYPIGFGDSVVLHPFEFPACL